MDVVGRRDNVDRLRRVAGEVVIELIVAERKRTTSRTDVRLLPVDLITLLVFSDQLLQAVRIREKNPRIASTGSLDRKKPIGLRELGRSWARPVRFAACAATR